MFRLFSFYFRLQDKMGNNRIPTIHLSKTKEVANFDMNIKEVRSWKSLRSTTEHRRGSG